MKKICKVFLVIVLLFTLISTATMANEDTLDTILKRGIIKVAFSVDVPPFRFRDKNNEPAGLCADFAKALARDLGVKIEYVFSDWQGLIPNLLSGRADIIMADMGMTLERAKKVNFTNPWMEFGDYIMVRNDSEWTSWKDMNKENVKIGSILGTTGESTVKKLLPKAELLTYNSIAEEKLALDQGRVDGIVNTKWYIFKQVAQSNGKLRYLPEVLLRGDYARFTLRSDDFHFLIWMNAWLETMEYSGEYDELINYWVMTEEWQKDYPGY